MRNEVSMWRRWRKTRKGEEERASRRARLEWTGGKKSNHWMTDEVLQRVCFGCLVGRVCRNRGSRRGLSIKSISLIDCDL